MNLTPLENWIMGKTGLTEKSREALEDYQLARLRETVLNARESSRFYKEYLKNIRMDAMRSFEDFRSVPFTFPHQISESPLAFLCVPQSKVKRIVTLKSSGTSGAEKRIYFSEEDLDLTVDFFQYGMRCLVGRTDRVLVLLPGSSYGSIGDLLKKALSQMGIACFVHGVVTDRDKTARCIVENDITCIVGIPVQVLQLSRTQTAAFQRIKSVLLSADYVPEVLIHELTNRYNCRVFSHYGMTEMGYGGGVECEARNGYHMREADFYFEIVDPVTGLPVPDGQWGEVVFTTLTRKAMPLIRYRTGDIAAFSALPCACGTFLKTMKRIRGRLENKIKICENKYLNLTELDEIVFSFHEVLDYKVSRLSENRIHVELVTENNAVFQRGEALAERIRQGISEKFGSAGFPLIRISQNPAPEQIASSMTKRTVSDAGTH